MAVKTKEQLVNEMVAVFTSNGKREITAESVRGLFVDILDTLDSKSSGDHSHEGLFTYKGKIRFVVGDDTGQYNDDTETVYLPLAGNNGILEKTVTMSKQFTNGYTVFGSIVYVGNTSTMTWITGYHMANEFWLSIQGFPILDGHVFYFEYAIL